MAMIACVAALLRPAMYPQPRCQAKVIEITHCTGTQTKTRTSSSLPLPLRLECRFCQSLSCVLLHHRMAGTAPPPAPVFVGLGLVWAGTYNPPSPSPPNPYPPLPQPPLPPAPAAPAGPPPRTPGRGGSARTRAACATAPCCSGAGGRGKGVTFMSAQDSG